MATFGDTATRHFTRTPLKDAKHALTSSQNYANIGGTTFSSGFKEASILAETGAPDEKVLLVFGSDTSRQSPPVSGGLSSIPLCYRFNGAAYASFRVHLQQLIATRGKSLSLHFLQIYKEGKPWLEFLANATGGTLHASGVHEGVAPAVGSAPGIKASAIRSSFINISSALTSLRGDAGGSERRVKLEGVASSSEQTFRLPRTLTNDFFEVLTRNCSTSGLPPCPCTRPTHGSSITRHWSIR